MAAQPRPRQLSFLSCVVPCHNEAANLERLLLPHQEALAVCVERWKVSSVNWARV